MELKKIKLGNAISLTDVRNDDLSVSLLLGVSNEKKIIPSIANTNGTDLSKYKILKKNQFVYVPTTSRNGDKVSISMLKEFDACIVSSSYTTFEVVDKKLILPDYLMLIFSTPEFDRYARYNSWGTAREVFSWEDLCDTEIHIPTVAEQEKIVNQYNAIVNRIDMLERLNGKLNELLTTYFENFLEQNEYDVRTIADYGEVVTGKTPPMNNEQYYNSKDIPFVKTPDMHDGIFVCNTADYLSYAGADSQKTKYLNENTVVMTCIGSAGILGITTRKSQTNQQINAIRTEHTELLYLLLRKFIPELLILGDGSTTMTNINKTSFEKFPMPMFKETQVLEIEQVIKPIFKTIREYEIEIFKLNQMKKMLISKL